eukprot:GHVS01038631.1.p1 GENE.GHVS01038631.1~~GHVS01038631.1.p1  ORF type:complete len:416 (-),score=73.10 GHVS01038631.1:320-1492(-)
MEQLGSPWLGPNQEEVEEIHKRLSFVANAIRQQQVTAIERFILDKAAVVAGLDKVDMKTKLQPQHHYAVTEQQDGKWLPPSLTRDVLNRLVMAFANARDIATNDWSGDMETANKSTLLALFGDIDDSLTGESREMSSRSSGVVAKVNILGFFAWLGGVRRRDGLGDLHTWLKKISSTLTALQNKEDNLVEVGLKRGRLSVGDDKTFLVGVLELLWCWQILRSTLGEIIARDTKQESKQMEEYVALGTLARRLETVLGDAFKRKVLNAVWLDVLEAMQNVHSNNKGASRVRGGPPKKGKRKTGEGAAAAAAAAPTGGDKVLLIIEQGRSKAMEAVHDSLIRIAIEYLPGGCNNAAEPMAGGGGLPNAQTALAGLNKKTKLKAKTALWATRP